MDSDSILAESGRNKLTSESKEIKEIGKNSSGNSPTFFLTMAGIATMISLGLAVGQKKKSWANFTGQWVPTILLLGIYNKIWLNKNLEKTETKSILH